MIIITSAMYSCACLPGLFGWCGFSVGFLCVRVVSGCRDQKAAHMKIGHPIGGGPGLFTIYLEIVTCMIYTCFENGLCSLIFHLIAPGSGLLVKLGYIQS